MKVETGGQQKTVESEPSSSSLNFSLNHDHVYTSHAETSDETNVKSTNEPSSNISAEVQDHSYGSSANLEPPSPCLTEPYSDSNIGENLIAKDGETFDMRVSTREDDQTGLATSGATDNSSGTTSEHCSTDEVSDVTVQVKSHDNSDDGDEIDGKEVNTDNTKAKEGKRRRCSSKGTESDDEPIKGKSRNVLF